jgi:hypothetical protein
MGAMIRIQYVLRRLGMRIVPRGELGFFLRVMSRVRMRVVHGVVFIIFCMSILVKACR